MRGLTIAGVAALAIVGSSTVYAQYRPWFHDDAKQHARFSPEDRAAFADARIAAVHAGLKLRPDQEALWPPVEAAVRELVKLRIDRSEARMQGRRDAENQQRTEDPVARLRDRAESMAAMATAMKKVADAADPLYKSLDEDQKRRLAVLTHHGGAARFWGGGGWGGWRHHWMERRMDRDGGSGSDGTSPSGERL